MPTQRIEKASYRGVLLRKYTYGDLRQYTAQFGDDEEELVGHLLTLLRMIDFVKGEDESLLKDEFRSEQHKKEE